MQPPRTHEPASALEKLGTMFFQKSVVFHRHPLPRHMKAFGCCGTPLMATVRPPLTEPMQRQRISDKFRSGLGCARTEKTRSGKRTISSQ